MDKDDINIIHMYTVILLSHNKEQNAICSNMDGPGYCQKKKGKKSEKKGKISYDITYMCNLKKMVQMKLFKKEIHM